MCLSLTTVTISAPFSPTSAARPRRTPRRSPSPRAAAGYERGATRERRHGQRRNLAGRLGLKSVGIASVRYEVSGGSVNNQVVSSSTDTTVGWLGAWDTTDVANGTYTVQSVAADTLGQSTTSAPTTVTVANQPLATAVLVPSNGATLSGSSAALDASRRGRATSPGSSSSSTACPAPMRQWGPRSRRSTAGSPSGA